MQGACQFTHAYHSPCLPRALVAWKLTAWMSIGAECRLGRSRGLSVDDAVNIPPTLIRDAATAVALAPYNKCCMHQQEEVIIARILRAWRAPHDRGHRSELSESDIDEEA